MEPGFTCSNCGHRDIVEAYKTLLPSRLLRTNDPPLVSEEDSIRRILDKEAFERELAALDEQISGYLRAAEALRRRREKRVEDFSSARRILSPIRRVPPEIIGEIVLAALADSDGISLDVRKGPWVYGRVCSLWRGEVLSSTVWSNINVRHSEPDNHHYLGRPLAVRPSHSHSPAATILREIFLRSNKQPCRLKLCIKFESPVAKDLLAAAVENSPSWFDVELDLASQLLPGLEPVQDRIPLLQRLRIHPTIAGVDPFVSVNCFRHSPALRSLNLRGISEIHLLKLPWAQLIEFHHFAGSCPTNHLRSMSNLISLICYGRDRLSSNDEIVLQSLRTLDARQSDSTLLAVFRLPALEDLRVNGSQLLAIPGLVQRSSCSLKHLCFEDSPAAWDGQFSATRFVPVLQQIPEIHSLDLSHSSSALVFQIIRLIIGMQYLPRLRRLTLPGVLIRDPLKLLVQVVESRRSCSPLEEIRLTSWSGMLSGGTSTFISNLALLNEIRAGGVKVVREGQC
ncbi:hypothetical protein C8J56DRAFT_922985 [Mycena floridula]|nr:hypothetical protein C8J56DRAFT_922985 [Mycena floridula]